MATTQTGCWMCGAATSGVEFKIGDSWQPVCDEHAARLNRLPELSGSEAQVAWASDIRARFVADVSANIAADPAIKMLSEKLAGNPGDEARAKMAFVKETREANFWGRVAPTLEQSEAKWWIDRRHIDAFNFATVSPLR